jgi:hypothetical protein
MLEAGGSRVRFPVMRGNVFNLPKPPKCSTALEMTHPLHKKHQEFSCRRRGNTLRPTRKANNLSAICELII